MLTMLILLLKRIISSAQPSFEVLLFHFDTVIHQQIFLEAVASLGLVVSLSQSVSHGHLTKLENELCKRKYKWIQKVIIVS